MRMVDIEPELGGEGREAQEGGDTCIIRLIFIVVWQKPIQQHCEAIFLQLNIF